MLTNLNGETEKEKNLSKGCGCGGMNVKRILTICFK